MITLQDLKIGQSAVIKALGGEGALRQHMLDMGLLPGETITLKQFAPMGDPLEITVRGYELTLRRSDAANITVEPLEAADREEGTQDGERRRSRKEPPMVPDHPGLGEEGKYHVKADENPVPKGTVLTFALAATRRRR